MLQGIPTPPTDNLYKFIAIFGLFLIGMCITGFVVIHKSLLEHELKETDSIENGFNKALNRFIKDKELNVKEESEIIATIEAEIQLPMTRLAEFEKNMELEVARFGDLPTLLIILGCTGAAMSLIGFILWWFRVQKYQDAILHSEYLVALKANREHGEQR